jgi:SH3 domain-containing YSC84-like protein 1
MHMNIGRTLALAALAVAALPAQTVDRLEEAGAVLSEVMEISDKAIPQGLLDKAACIVVVPGVKKGAFIVGAKYGRGFISCRKEGGVGWTGPGAIRVEGGSVGFQIGGSETDVIMLVMNDRGAEKLMRSKFTLGGDASVAAGPVGRTASAETDAFLRAEILTWSRSRGAFVGVSLRGATLREDRGANKDIYQKDVKNADIIRDKVPAPEAASELISLLNKYSSRRVS